jgi:uncharacterized Zn finger protein
MPFTPLSKSQIQEHTAGGSFERGRRYFADGAVEHLEVQDGKLEAHVRGSDPMPYAVAIEHGGDDSDSEERIEHASCTCPYHEGSWCKHIVAALLAYREAGEDNERERLQSLLAGADREALVALVGRLVERDARVEQWVEEELLDGGL